MPTRKKTAHKKTAARKAPKASPKARKPSQLDRIEAAISKVHEELLSVRSIAHHARTAARVNTGKLDLLLSGATFMQELDKAKEEPQPIGLSPGDYTDASKETADALTAMGWGWFEGDHRVRKQIMLAYNMKMAHVSGISGDGSNTHLTPAEFLLRAAVTAKELRLVPVVEEPKVLNVGQWIKFRDGSWQTKEYGGIAKVKSGPDEEGHYLTEDVSAEPMGYYFAMDEAGPATEQEIAAHLAEQEAKKPLEFGTRVNHTTRGKGIWMGMDGILHELAFLKHGENQQHQWSTILCPRDQFTVIEQP